jgi:hypothetical protein
LFTISTGNKKLKQTLIFNIPAVKTCPGRTPLCESLCYAIKAETLYKHTLPSRERNFTLTRDKNFADSFIAFLTDFLSRKRSTFSFFRIHESGDFYSQAYLHAWFTICRAFPQIRFLAFTKSWHLDFSGAPENLRIRYSVWSDTRHHRDDLPLALMDDVPATRKIFACKPGFECGGSKRCRYCWIADKDVSFHLH